ncbi:MAG: response regulator transcription factor [Chloroflexota bacterium]
MESPGNVRCITWASPSPVVPGDVPGVSATIRVASPVALRDAIARDHPAVIVLPAPPVGVRVIRLTAELRAARADLRLIVLTDADAAALRVDALAWGVDEALALPIDPAELTGRIALHASRLAHARTTGTVVAPGVVLDPVSHALRRDGRRVHLRPMEYRLLAELARTPGAPRTRADLLATVWRGRTAADSRTVDVHVRWLRAKIERDARHPVHLVTVRGLGYVLDPEALGPLGAMER